MDKTNKYIIFDVLPLSMMDTYTIGVKYRVSYEDIENYYIKHYPISKREENITYIVVYIQKPKDVKN